MLSGVLTYVLLCPKDGVSFPVRHVSQELLNASFFVPIPNRRNSLREKLKIIFKSTRQHARNLATFAAIYKASMLVLRHSSPTQKEESPHTFLAGLLGGYMVFGRGKSGQSSVNQQIVIYVFARVVLGLAKLSVQRKRAGGLGLSPDMKDRLNANAWPVFAAVSWGMVMWLFRWFPEVLQPSLKSSMKYMYVFHDPSKRKVWEHLLTLSVQIC